MSFLHSSIGAARNTELALSSVLGVAHFVQRGCMLLERAFGSL